MDGGVGKFRSPRRALLAASALLAAVAVTGALAGPARADSFRIFAGGHGHIGNPSAGGVHRTSATALTGSGTLFGTGGSAPYAVAAGPGVARAALSGGFTNPFLLTIPFAPVAEADTATTLTVTGAPGQLTTSLNLHVDGTVRHVCEAGLAACETRISIVADMPGQSLFTDANTTSGLTRNTLGLTLTPTPDGFRLSGDVETPPFLVTANTAFDVRVRVTVEVGVSGGGFEASTTWDSDYGVSFAPAGPVLNLPPGYDVAGSAVVRNRWRDPFAPAPIDTVAPVVTGMPARPADANGWYRAPVLIDWQGVDPEPSSGTPSDPPDTLADREGNVLYASGDSCDPVGNCSSGTLLVPLDMTPPTVTCDAPMPVFVLGSEALVRAEVTDALSGPAADALLTFADTSTVGEKTIVMTGHDLAGHETAQACPYRIEFGFEGFGAPVANAPAVNLITAGRTVPLTWRLTDASGAPVADLAGAALTTLARDCDFGTSADDVAEELVAGSGLQHLGDGWYQLNWKTPRSYADSCRTLRLDLGEGVLRAALFRFR